MILIVEDDPQVGRLIALVLERGGFDGEVVGDGVSALARAQQSSPELIFADLTVQGMSGDVLCRRLKGDPATSGIPFVVLSGDRDIAERAQECGADDYLGKPFEFDELIRIARKHVEG
ncbi:MAG TPA: response regulator [Thermoanaerobaculia bacterium]|nr:response regulator [Thermoanaerobaculia bacterium]